jgi:Zn-dependent protease with chaperone function
VLPDLSLLLGLVLGLFFLQDPSAEDRPDALFAAGGTAAVVLVVAALARMAADRAVRAADETDPEGVLAASRRIGFLPLMGWLATLYVFRWGAFVSSSVPRTWFLAPYLLLFLPLLSLFAAAWAAGRRVEARLSDKAPSTWGAIARGLRRNSLVLVPLLVLFALSDAVAVLEAWDVPGVRTAVAWHRAFPDLAAAVSLVVVAAFGLAAPSLFRRALKATPIPPGELRRDLEGMSKAIGLRVRDFLLWDTRGRTVNAMVVGLTAGTRYVFLSDGLLDRLSRPEVMAVVAHEAGHAKRGHLPLYFVVAVAMVLLLETAKETAAPWLDPAGSLWITLLFLGVFWFGVLGWLSRRFEREADAFGADHGAALDPGAGPVEVPGASAPVPYGAAVMVAVLRRLERIVGPVRHHRHAPPPERVAFLVAYATDPAVRASFEGDRRRTRLGIVVLLLVALATVAARVPGGIVRGHANLRLLEAEEWAQRSSDARRRHDDAAALDDARRAREGFAAVAAAAEERPRDVALALVGAIGAYDAADLDRRRFSDRLSARTGFEQALRLADRARTPETAQLRFHALAGLALLDLHGDGPLDPRLEAARRRVEAAKAIGEEFYSGPLRRAWTRLLDSALRLREADPQRAAQARADLESQTQAGGDGEEWADLREDAAAELRAGGGS